MTPPAMHAERLAPVCFYLDRWMWLVSGLGERCQADIQMQCCPDVTAVSFLQGLGENCQIRTGSLRGLTNKTRGQHAGPGRTWVHGKRSPQA